MEAPNTYFFWLFLELDSSHIIYVHWFFPKAYLDISTAKRLWDAFVSMDHNMDGMLEEDELLQAVWASRPEAIDPRIVLDKAGWMEESSGAIFCSNKIQQV